MENVILVVHLLLALSLVGIVLLQRSEGGGLGIGGGGGSFASRAPTTGMAKVTWVLAIAFICTSLTLTIFAARNATGSSVVDRLGGVPAQSQTAPGEIDTDALLPPPSGTDTGAPLVPRAD